MKEARCLVDGVVANTSFIPRWQVNSGADAGAWLQPAGRTGDGFLGGGRSIKCSREAKRQQHLKCGTRLRLTSRDKSASRGFSAATAAVIAGFSLPADDHESCVVKGELHRFHVEDWAA